MATIFYVEVENSGYIIDYFIVENSIEEAKKTMENFIKDQKIGNGYAKIKKIKKLSGKHQAKNIYRPVKEGLINSEALI